MYWLTGDCVLAQKSYRNNHVKIFEDLKQKRKETAEEKEEEGDDANKYATSNLIFQYNENNELLKANHSNDRKTVVNCLRIKM